jgi:hypothetical protein
MGLAMKTMTISLLMMMALGTLLITIGKEMEIGMNLILNVVVMYIQALKLNHMSHFKVEVLPGEAIVGISVHPPSPTCYMGVADGSVQYDWTCMDGGSRYT